MFHFAVRTVSDNTVSQHADEGLYAGELGGGGRHAIVQYIIRSVIIELMAILQLQSMLD